MGITYRSEVGRMSEVLNNQWRLRSRPVGMVRTSDFEFVQVPLQKPTGTQFLVRNLYISIDPAMRGWLNGNESYMPPVQIGEVMRAITVGQVIESESPDFESGDYVRGMLGWQDYAICGSDSEVGKLPKDTTPQLALSVLGGTGLTAYFGLLEIGRPTEGDVVLVSGAAGATGSVVGQIAKIKGASKVVGIAGGPQKCMWLTQELGFDAALDYKTEDINVRIAEECPEGVNVFFDNVGGEILDAGLVNMAMHGSVVLCGGISSYNDVDLPAGPRNYMQLIVRRCRMEGFIVFDYMHRAHEAIQELSTWMAEGRIKHVEDIQEGIENAPKTLLRLFEGKNFGKQLLKIADAPI